MAPLSSVASVLALTISFAVAVPQKQVEKRNDTLVPEFWLAGDSTTHIGSGWGDGFLATLKPPASGTNLGHSGDTLGSFRSQGIWATILSNFTEYKATRECFTTIQFGHNDQKSVTGEADYSPNLEEYVSDANKAGGIPIIVTPICRRDFANGSLVRNLATETAKALAVANSTGSRFIDLNKASCDYVEAIGQTASKVYNYDGTDRTHLNPWGTTVFGRMVSDLLVAKYADIAAWTIPNATMSALLAANKPV